jgi:hypothetical protein
MSGAVKRRATRSRSSAGYADCPRLTLEHSFCPIVVFFAEPALMLFGRRRLLMRRPSPNTRVQRTRSSASPPHSPLTRHPLGTL